MGRTERSEPIEGFSPTLPDRAAMQCPGRRDGDKDDRDKRDKRKQPRLDAATYRMTEIERRGIVYRRDALLRLGAPGITGITEIEREPHRGQRKRSFRSNTGKSRPRVASSVVVQSSNFQSHFLDELPVSIVPCRQTTVKLQPALWASPRVSIVLMLSV